MTLNLAKEILINTDEKLLKMCENENNIEALEERTRIAIGLIEIAKIELNREME